MDRAIDEAVIKRRRLKRLSIGVPVAAAVAILFALLPGWLRPSVSRSRIVTARVERGTVEATLDASGTVVPASERVYASPIETRVLRILRRPGERVAAGDAILDLDTATTRLEIDRLVERLAQKRNERKRLELSLEKDLGALRSQAESRRLDVEIQEYRVQQRRTLRTEGLISEENLKEIEVEASKARIELARLEEEAGNAGRAAAAQVEGVALEAKILDKEIAEAKRQLDLATTRTDLDGIVTWVVPQEGTAVRRGDVVARVARPDSFRVEGTISDVHASRLSAGMPAHVVVDGRSLGGTLSTVLPAIESGAVKFLVDLENPSDAALRQNLRVDVHVVTDLRPDTLRLRKGSFPAEGAVQEVFVVEGSRALKRKVRMGVTGAEALEVIEGLDAGEKVILSDMRDYRYLDEIKVR